jgi:cation diffusion facilitator family transporter
MHTQDLSA